VEVKFEEEGVILVRKILSLEKVQRNMAGRLPQWSRLEGKADRLVLQEVRSKNR